MLIPKPKKAGWPRDTSTSLNDPGAMSREVGDRLREFRTDAGLEVAELAARTRISARYIQALEEGRFDLLPGSFFARGFIKSICAELDRDPDPLLEEVLAIQEEESAEEENGSNGPGSRKTIPLCATACVLVFLVIGGIWLYGGGNGEGRTEETIREEAVPPPEPAVPVQVPEVIPPAEPVREEEPLEELDLVIRAIERTWLRIQTDSSEPWETTLRTGDEIQLRGIERISLFIGNAGGILFELNGKRFGPPGSSGQVISSYVITRDNL